MAKGIVIAGFAGIWKTTLAKKYSNVMSKSKTNSTPIFIKKHFLNVDFHNPIKDLLQKFKITNIRKSRTPCSTITKSPKNDKPFDKTIFKSAIGSLIYLSRCTRPDITFAIGKAARIPKILF